MENTAAARSIVMDTDFAEEAVELVRSDLLFHASIGALSRITKTTGSVLDLMA